MDAWSRKKLDRLSAGVIGLLAIGLCAGAYVAFSPKRGAPRARPAVSQAGQARPKPAPAAVESPDPLPAVKPVSTQPAVPFKVRGVIYSAEGRSVVFIEQGGKVGLFCVGDRLPEGWIVSSIGIESAVIDRDGQNVTLSLERVPFKEPLPAIARNGASQGSSALAAAPARGPQRSGSPDKTVRQAVRTASVSGGPGRIAPPPDAARNSDATVAVDPDVAAIARQDPTSLIQGVQFEPLMQKGAMQGFQINSVPGGSLAATYGLATGDRIVAVNNQPITSLDQAWSLYSQFRDTSAVNVTIIRNGQKKVVTYYVP